MPEESKSKKKSSHVRKKRTAKVHPSNSLTTEKKEISHRFPPEITVDQLYLFRKKRSPASNKPRDNIEPAEGTFKQIKSEYKRRFCSFNVLESLGKEVKKLKDSLKPEGDLEPKPETQAASVKPSLEKIDKRVVENLSEDILGKMDVQKDVKTMHQELIRTRRKSHPFGRPTNLKLEGEFFGTTEQAEQFIEYLLQKRAELLRTPTTLKMEGEMNGISEMKDKYVLLSLEGRPHLCRKDTVLHLEGDLDHLTENRDQYHPCLNKECFRPPFLPINNLKVEGLVDTTVSENTEKFINHQVHPVVPFLRSGINYGPFTLGNDHTTKKAEYKEKFIEYPQISKPRRLRPDEHLKAEGPMETLTENKKEYILRLPVKTESRKATNNLVLEGNIDLTPEYKNAYVDFSKDEKMKVRRRRSTSHPPINLRTEGEMNVHPEYRSAYVDFPRQRPILKRPDNHLRSEGDLSTMTEKRAQYVEHPRGSRTRPLKREPELKLEGRFECQPEYRKAYIDYLIRERRERIPRPLDNIETIPSRVFPESSVLLPLPKPSEQESLSLLEDAKRQLLLAELESDKSPEDKTVEKPPNKVLDSRSLEKIEKKAFGPKVKSTSSTLPSSNLPKMRPKATSTIKNSRPEKKSKQEELDAALRQARSKKKFRAREMVQNLAYTPVTSPLPPVLHKSVRKRWLDQAHPVDPDDKAFVVLLKEKNNNAVQFSNRNDQRWIPSRGNRSLN